MISAITLIAFFGSTQSEFQQAETIMTRVLDASLHSSYGRPALLNVSLAGAHKQDVSADAFSIISSSIMATFDRNPTQLRSLQVFLPRNRNLDGQSLISNSDLKMIAKGVARHVINAPYSPEDPVPIDVHGRSYHVLAKFGETTVDAFFAISITLDPWSGCVTSMTAPVDYSKFQPPAAWTPGITADVAYLRAYEAYAATSPLPYETIIDRRLVLRRPNFPATWSQLTSEHSTASIACRLMPFYRVMLEALIGGEVQIRHIYVDARTGVPTAVVPYVFVPMGSHRADTFKGYVPGGSMKVVGTDDELVVGARQSVVAVKGHAVNVVLRDGEKRLVLAKAWPASKALEILGAQYPYFGTIDLAKLKKLKPLPAGKPIHSGWAVASESVQALLPK